MYQVLNGEAFDAPLEVRVVIEDWRHEYNQHRSYSSLGCRPPAIEIRHLRGAILSGDRSGANQEIAIYGLYYRGFQNVKKVVTWEILK
jgi:hypothetical protein